MASLIVLTPRIRTGMTAPVAIRLAGTGTSWSGGTTFTVSGVAGVSKAGQVVDSTTQATVLVTTGTTTGTATVSDGTNTAHVAIVRSRNVGPRRWYSGLSGR